MKKSIRDNNRLVKDVPQEGQCFQCGRIALVTFEGKLKNGLKVYLCKKCRASNMEDEEDYALPNVRKSW